MTRIVGIDPGLTGGIALIDDYDGTVIIEDLPTVKDGKKSSIAAPVLADIVAEMKPDIVWMERVHASPGAGVTSMFSFGDTFGSLKGVVGALKIPLRLVTPGEWKKFFRLKGGAENKDHARLRALELFPTASDRLARKKDHNRAEALLIAEYGRRTSQ